MTLNNISKWVLVGCVALGLAACSSPKPAPQLAKPPRHMCDAYEAHIVGIKDGMHKEAINYDYAKANNCPYDDSDINAAYLKGYQSGRQMK
ncbi:MAG: hypothetical protein EXR81_04055 [Gammaproteobacteria bacterium]|nr:hypothetical protein [Gammaproteobacteria bacterium]